MRKTLGYTYSIGLGITLLFYFLNNYNDYLLILQIILLSLYPFIRENFGFKGDNIKYYRALQIIFFAVFILSYIFDFRYGLLTPALILLNNIICYQKFLTWGEFRNDEIQKAKVP